MMHSRHHQQNAQYSEHEIPDEYTRPNKKTAPPKQIPELLISDKTVQMIMGPDPIPSLDIEMSEIQNELQRKMVEEI